jgi:glycerol-3-phosphate dehydrogenase (NAD(P)+)
MKEPRINVIGAGSWGTALAIIVNRLERKTYLWGREQPLIDEINAHHTNAKYLSDVSLSGSIIATTDLTQVVQAEILLVSVPVAALRDLCKQMAKAGLQQQTILVLCAKGIEVESLKLTSEIVEEILPGQPVAVLSGPNFAKEVALGQPTASTISCKDLEQAKYLAQLIGSPSFRLYASADIIGVQLAGALKNVLAIACGVARGIGFGENTVAALITRGLAEISRFIIAKGGHVSTVMGLAGIGDVMLTCSSLNSRNTNLGYQLGKGTPLQKLLMEQHTVVEGVNTTESVYHLAQQLNIDMPIFTEMYHILYENYDIDEAVHNLLARPLTTEGQL